MRRMQVRLIQKKVYLPMQMTYRSNYGRCHKCKRIRVLVNKKYELCRECNKQRLGVKTKTKPLKSYRKSTGELTLFHRIWNKRYHISAISKEPLNKYFFEDIETHKSTLPLCAIMYYLKASILSLDYVHGILFLLHQKNIILSIM